MLAAARFPHISNVRPHTLQFIQEKSAYLEERHDAIEDLAVSSHHNRELRIASADVAARHCELTVEGKELTWGIQREHVLLLGGFVNFHSQGRLAGGHVHNDAFFLHDRQKMSRKIHGYRLKFHSLREPLLEHHRGN